jgi:chemotaxis protein histidine kinase CheA
VGELYEEIRAVRRLNERFRSFAAVDRANSTEQQRRRLADFLRALKRMINELAAELGKKARLRAFGSFDDASLFARLRGPIIQIVRNAVDHGIEDPLERISNGKQEEGQIVIRFADDQDGKVVEILDDGRGVDYEAVRRKAIELGVLEQGEEPTRSRLTDILFSPSFSSRDEVTDISGRGVGLDAVKEVIQELRGEVLVSSQVGRGTRFRINLPRSSG